MSVSQNEFLFNGNVWLNGNDHLLHQRYQYAFPDPDPIPDLNLLPEMSAVTEKGDAMCFSSTPIPSEKSNTPPGVHPISSTHVLGPREELQPITGEVEERDLPKQYPVIDSIKTPEVKQRGVPSYNFVHSTFSTNVLRPIEELQPVTGDAEGINLPKQNPIIDSTKTPEVKQMGVRTYNFVHSNNIHALRPREEVQPITENVEETSLPKQNPVIDSTKTPEVKKPKRKKHVPKVVRDGKPARKLATPKPPTPKPPRNLENPSGKRKYVRKKKNLDNLDPISCPVAENVGQESTSEAASVKRRLNFDSSGQQQAKDGHEVPYAKGQDVLLENRPSEPTFDLNNSPNDFLRIPQTPNRLYQPSRRNTMGQTHILNGHAGVLNKSPFPIQKSRQEVIRDNLKQFALNSGSITITDNRNMPPKTGMENQSGLNNATLSGIKRDHTFVDEELVPTRTNFIHANNSISYINGIPFTSRYRSHFPESQKRNRTETGQNELTSNASISVNHTPASNSVNHTLTTSFRMRPPVPNNCQVSSFSDAGKPTTTSWSTGGSTPIDNQMVTFIDQQMMMFLEKMVAPGNMLSFGQGDVTRRKVPERPIPTNNLTSRRDCNNPSTPAKPSEFRSTECRVYKDSHNISDHGKKKTRKYTRKKQSHLLSSDLISLQDRQSCSKGVVISLQDRQSCSKGSTPEDSINDLVGKLKHLDISGFYLPAKAAEPTVDATLQNALVLYGGGDNMMVPYESPLDYIKRRRLRLRVKLDAETNRVWNVLMGKESNDEKIDREQKHYWEEERKTFVGRVDAFIAKMNHIQGNRCFSRWKGSVVDSVVGVFLTQNVADHLSSSAFMNLAARFPIRPTDDNSTPNTENVSRSTEERESCIIDLDDSIKVLGQEIGSQGSSVNPEHEHNAVKEMAEMANSNPVSSQNSSEYQVQAAPEHEHNAVKETSEMANSNPVSSQNSSEYQVQTADQIQMNLSPAMYGGMSNEFVSSTSFLGLLHMAETTGFQGLSARAHRDIPSTESCGGVQHLASIGVDERTYASGTNFEHTDTQDYLASLPYVPSPLYDPLNLHFGLFADGNINSEREEDISHLFSNAPGLNSTNPIDLTGNEFDTSTQNIPITDTCGTSAENSTDATTRTAPAFDLYDPECTYSLQPITCSVSETCFPNPSNLTRENQMDSSERNTLNNCCYAQDEQIVSREEITEHAIRAQVQMPSSRAHEPSLSSHNNLRETLEVMEEVDSNLKTGSYSPTKFSAATSKVAPKRYKAKPVKPVQDWDNLRKQACPGGLRKERSKDSMDSVDWEAVRAADVKVIAKTIEKRGMSNMLAARIKIFLDRIVQDHGGIDLEWLRDVPPQDAKDYLLDIKGLGLKSVECVRLLTLLQLAFPVDINVCRIIVRLGWVPLEPLPEMLLFHGLEVYPTLDSVQKYIWPRLCKLDQRTLYELHYHLITFGKVFCTKRAPNCRACPMQAECKHYASACASQLLPITAPEEKRIVKSTPIAFGTNNTPAFNPLPFPQLTGPALSEQNAFSEQNPANNWEPIIEEPKTPEHEPEPEAPLEELLQRDIEDAFNGDDPEEIPFIDLIPLDVRKYLEEHNMEFHGEMSQALVALDPRAASVPTPKLKNKSRLRTEHLVYQLPDSHPLLENLEPRDADDPCSYCLAIWSPGETAESTEVPQYRCNTRDSGGLCDMMTCVGCNSAREAQTQTVRGTIMIPVRTAMRGSFPLNGTYFQVNELFADHASSCDPINVPRAWLGHLPRKTVLFGTSVTTLFKGLSTEEVQKCFYQGCVCVRGFDQISRRPKPLQARFHLAASRTLKNGKPMPVPEEDE